MNRLIFRKIEQQDANQLYQIYSDKEAMKYRGSQPMESISEAEIFIQNQELLKDGILTIRKGIEIKEQEELIGSVMLRFNQSRKTECIIGYSIGRQFWGMGFGKEIVRMLIENIAEDEKIQDIIAWSHQENIASIKILEQNGFQRIEQNEYENSYLYVKNNKGFKK